jgi:excisionase family DNA binding protein
MERQRVLTFEEGCRYLGYKPSYVYKLTSGGVLPFSKPRGGKIFFDREKLDEWMLSNAHSGSLERNRKAATHVAANSLT